jgi:hypothetical protein
MILHVDRRAGIVPPLFKRFVFSGCLYEMRGAAKRDGYRDVSTLHDPKVVVARQRFETYLGDFPPPDENETSTRQTCHRLLPEP